LVRIDPIECLLQGRQIDRLEAIVLTRTVEPHDGSTISHRDNRDSRLGSRFRMIGHRSASFNLEQGTVAEPGERTTRSALDGRNPILVPFDLMKGLARYAVLVSMAAALPASAPTPATPGSITRG